MVGWDSLTRNQQTLLRNSSLTWAFYGADDLRTGDLNLGKTRTTVQPVRTRATLYRRIRPTMRSPWSRWDTGWDDNAALPPGQVGQDSSSGATMRRASSSDLPNAWITSRWSLRTVRISIVDAFPCSQPDSLGWRAVEREVSEVGFLRDSHEAVLAGVGPHLASVALSSSTSVTCRPPGNSTASSRTRRRDMFWSNSNLTSAWRGAAPASPRSRWRRAHAPRLTQESQRQSPRRSSPTPSSPIRRRQRYRFR